jgi:AcrR family transcriptional regulator
MHATAPAAPPPARRQPGAERREQIARAAAAVFMRGGFDGTSMDDVARQAGVTRLIVYRIFESKDVLYRSVLDLVIDDLEAAFDPVAKKARDHATQSLARMVLTVARRHPDAFRLLWRHAAHEPQFRELAEQFKLAVIGFAVELFGESIADPLLRRWAAESTVSHLYESVCLWLDDGDPARDDECAAMITEGMRAMVGRWTELGRPTR